MSSGIYYILIRDYVYHSDQYHLKVETEHYELSLHSPINITPTPLMQNEDIEIQVDIANWGNIQYSGQLAVSIVDDQGQLVENVFNRELQLEPMTHFSNGLTMSKDKLEASPGKYKLFIFYTDNDEWAIMPEIPDKSYLNPIEITVQSKITTNIGRAIILGGGVASVQNLYWKVTKNLAVKAYLDFKNRGFSDDMIFFMINSQLIDIDNDDVPDQVVDDNAPSSNSFLDAIKTEFKDSLNSETPLFIYMIGHGINNGSFAIQGSNQYVSAIEIKSAVDELQKSINCHVVLILEFCYSGMFIEKLYNEDYPKRIIMSSSGNEQYFTDSSGAISFSRYLFSKLIEGDSFKKAFDYAKKLLVNIGYPEPLIRDDENESSNFYLNASMMPWDEKPIITSFDYVNTLSGIYSTPITVSINENGHEIDEVWIQIIAPSIDISGGNSVITYPQITLKYNNESNTYEGLIPSLIQPGLHTIIIWARNINNELSIPAIGNITTQIKTGDISGNGLIGIEDSIKILQLLSDFQ